MGNYLRIRDTRAAYPIGGGLNILLSNDFEKLTKSVNRLHEFVHVTCPKQIEDL